jgi:hypothetical protein
MANNFVRMPVNGGDDGVWAQYNDELNRAGGIGQYTCQLSDNAGNLEISKGLIGIQDGTNEGVSIIDTVTTINLAGAAAGNWAQIEMAVAGVGVTLTATTIAGATDETTLPAGFTGAYNGEKQGFYINATKRTIGLAWKNTGGTLEGVVNTLAFVNGYIGYSISDDALDTKYSFENINVDLDNFVNHEKITYLDSAGVTTIDKLYTKVIEIGDWDMNVPGLSIVNVAHELDLADIRSFSAMIRNDLDTSADMVDTFGTELFMSASATVITLRKPAGSVYETPDYDATSYNRGWIVITYMA